jgi:hypothetical protein
MLNLLTLDQVADILNVSADYVRKLMRQEVISFYGTPENAWFNAQHIFEYKYVRDCDSKRAADELTQLSQEMGLYGGIEADRERLINHGED